MVRGVAERALTRHGYRVITADNGEDALAVLGSGEQIDLLISDVVMPGMDGPTMVAEARKERPDLKIRLRTYLRRSLPRLARCRV